jgi:hypothetical protein
MTVRFDYTGANFVVVSGPFTTAEKVTGFVIVDRLPLTSERIATTVDAFSFSDGVVTISSANGGTLRNFIPRVNDATDTITSATLDVRSGPRAAPTDMIQSSAFGDTAFFDHFQPIAQTPFDHFRGTGQSLVGGTWSLDTTMSTLGLSVLDTTTSQSIAATAQLYAGPVAGLQEQYINVTSDSLNIGVSTPNWFIHSGSGTDAIAVNSGTNVLDGGTGSNFLTGGIGTDTFFVDDRAATADIWSTVVGFHAGDSATIWGITPRDFGLSFVDGQGAGSFPGLTLHATAPGKPTASLTLTGFTQADMASGRISVSFGTDAASGSNFMFIHANS